MRRHLRRILVVPLLAAIVVLGLLPASTASAATGCSPGYTWWNGYMGTSCQTGTYAVAGTCRNVFGWQKYVQGAKRSAPYASLAYCGDGWWPTAAWTLVYS